MNDHWVTIETELRLKNKENKLFQKLGKFGCTKTKFRPGTQCYKTFFTGVIYEGLK